MSTEAPRVSGQRLSSVLRKHTYRKDPVLWARERGRLHLWSAQKRIMEAVRQHRKVAVKSCHGPGKSYTAAQVVAWWLDIFPPGEAGCVTTAPSDGQVKTVLWKEIRRTHSRAGLMGRTNQKEWLMRRPGGEEVLVAYGKKPADKDPTGFQGTHFRYLLVILDEACGIPGETVETPNSLWVAADSLLTNEDCRMLAIGNPDDPTSEFAKVCKPGSGWFVIEISAFDTPNFTGEEVPEWIRKNLVDFTWVEERRREWAPTWTWNEDKSECIPPPGLRIEDSHPLWLSKVLGKFPENKLAHGLLPVQWVEQAMARELEPGDPNELGVDVGAGGDSSTTAHRRGSVVRIISEDHNPDTMQTCGKVVNERRVTKAQKVKVDRIGIGTGIVDRGKEQGEPFYGVNVGVPPICNCTSDNVKKHEQNCNINRFANLKAQLWWEVRDRFEIGDIDLDPNDRSTLAELTSLRYKRNSKGQILIESKDEAKRRGVASPNRAEAIMLSFAPAEEDEPQGGMLW